MKNVIFYSRVEIEKIVEEKLRKKLDLIYHELEQIKIKIIDLERISKK